MRWACRGRYHTLLTTDTGAVLSFGSGEYGRLGHGAEQSQQLPQVIESLRWCRAVAVAAGGMHSLVLGEDGRVYSFGYGGAGRLGHGSEAKRLAPTLVRVSTSARGTLTRAMAISAGRAHSLVLLEPGPRIERRLTTDRADASEPSRATSTRDLLHNKPRPLAGMVLSFGAGMDGQLGHGDEANQLHVTCSNPHRRCVASMHRACGCRYRRRSVLLSAFLIWMSLQVAQADPVRRRVRGGGLRWRRALPRARSAGRRLFLWVRRRGAARPRANGGPAHAQGHRGAARRACRQNLCRRGIAWC